MSVLYRALWSDESQKDPGGFIDKARAKFTAWAMEDPEAEPLPDGTAEVSLPQDRARLIDIRSVDGEGSAGSAGLECVTRDSTTDGDTSGTVWTTVMRVVANEAGINVWIENQVETEDVALRVQVGRPRMVDDLLSLPVSHTSPARDCSSTSSRSRPIKSACSSITSSRPAAACPSSCAANLAASTTDGGRSVPSGSPGVQAESPTYSRSAQTP